MAKNIDEVGDYLKSIGQIPMLKADEKIELGKQVKRMMSCWKTREKILEENPLVTEEEWAEQIGINVRELQGILKRGKRAKEKMVKANLRLVVAMCKKYQGKGLELLDLVQEGNLGLIRAVEKFEYEKGYKFSTYAYHWIRQALVRAIFDKGRTIRVPVHINEEIGKLKKVQLEIRQQSGRSATVEELSERLEITPSKVRLLREIKTPILSLDQKVLGDKDNSTLLNFLPDPNGDLGEFLENLGNKELVEQSLCILKPKEQRVLREYYLETPSKTLNEIAETMNVTRERVRQIKKKALHKLSQVIVTEKKDESGIIAVEFESTNSSKSRKFKTEEKTEETAKVINSINPFCQSVEIEEPVNFSQPIVRENPLVKVSDESSKIPDKVESDSLNISSKVVSKSAPKLSKNKNKVKKKKETNQSKVKRKSAAKSKPKTTTNLSKSQQRELKKQLNQLCYGK